MFVCETHMKQLLEKQSYCHLVPGLAVMELLVIFISSSFTVACVVLHFGFCDKTR